MLTYYNSRRQPDPNGLTGGWNRFVYVENNPIGATDPEGLQAATLSNTSRLVLPSIGGVCAATGGAACVALATGAAAGAVGVGSYVLTDRYVNPWLQPVISDAIDICMESRSRGERGATAGTSGTRTSNPYKHCRIDPKNHKFIICINHQTGKEVRKLKPTDWNKDK